jgi:predicted Zn-dependent protease
MKRTAIDVTGWMVLGMALFLSGCAITQEAAPVDERSATSSNRHSAPAKTETPEGVEVFPAQNAPLTQHSIEPMQTTPMPTTEPSTAAGPEMPRAVAPQSPAVVALLDNADRQAGSGKLDGAAAALERALRIEPRNAILWQRLADIRLRQKQPGQAESLALKSNTLAVADKATQAGNWRIIAKSRRMRSDADGARQADSRADALLGRDGGSAQ